MIAISHESTNTHQGSLIISARLLTVPYHTYKHDGRKKNTSIDAYGGGRQPFRSQYERVLASLNFIERHKTRRKSTKISH